MEYIHTTECYSASKRKGILSHVITWINLEDIMLSEMIQSGNEKYHIIPLLWAI
jgi:hypothetical protein